MRVVAVDAAPGKRSTVFDGRDFTNHDARSLRGYLARMRERHREMLVCWDAPLTGPGDPDDAGVPGDFTQRPIESFFRDGKNGCKTPRGISVRPYCGCPHWTISRSLLGLPRLGSYDAGYDELPFGLLTSGRPAGDGQHVVAEIHPGVAAWLWCREERRGNVSWAYKKDAVVLAEMWEIVRSKAAGAWPDRRTPANDDQFDAAVGYVLGRAFVGAEEGGARVAMFDDRRTGALLLPDSRELRHQWERWMSEEAVAGGRTGSAWCVGGEGAPAQ